jgi:hypothetical protein
MQISALELADADGIRGHCGAACRKPTGYLLQLVVLQFARNGLVRILLNLGLFASGLLGHAILVRANERNMLAAFNWRFTLKRHTFRSLDLLSQEREMRRMLTARVP